MKIRLVENMKKFSSEEKKERHFRTDPIDGLDQLKNTGDIYKMKKQKF